MNRIQQLAGAVAILLLALVAMACGLSPSPTPTPTFAPVCTPPPCTDDEVYYCPDECLGGCGTECATPTPGAGETSPDCTYEWVSALAENPPFSGCPREARYGRAVQQPFENGLMLWFRPSGGTFVFYDEDPGTGAPLFFSYFEGYDEGDPEGDPDIVPPDGLYQPVQGFGLVWRTYPEVREGLGWATAPAAEFETWRQDYSEQDPYAYFSLIQGIDGAIYRFGEVNDTWEVYEP